MLGTQSYALILGFSTEWFPCNHSVNSPQWCGLADLDLLSRLIAGSECAALRLHLNPNYMRPGHWAVNPFGLAGGVVSPAGGVPEHPIRVVVAEMLS